MKEYTVTVGGVEHTMLLDEDDAKRRGATEVKAPTKAATAPNKARAAANK